MLMINPQHPDSFLQAHLVCETNSSSRLILHETRLGLGRPGREWIGAKGVGVAGESGGESGVRPRVARRNEGRRLAS
jgi:hypothetical protein